jgi:hypothetical protein
MPQPSPLDMPMGKCDAVQGARLFCVSADDQRGKRLPYTGNAQPRRQRSGEPE